MIFVNQFCPFSSHALDSVFICEICWTEMWPVSSNCSFLSAALITSILWPHHQPHPLEPLRDLRRCYSLVSRGLSSSWGFLQHYLLEVDATVSFWHRLGRGLCSHLPLSFRRCLWGTSCCCYWLDLQRGKNAQEDFLTPHSVGGEMSWILCFRLYTFTAYPPQAAATTSICPMAFKCPPQMDNNMPDLFGFNHVGELGRSLIRLFKYILDPDATFLLLWLVPWVFGVCHGRPHYRRSAGKEAIWTAGWEEKHRDPGCAPKGMQAGGCRWIHLVIAGRDESQSRPMWWRKQNVNSQMPFWMLYL